MGGIKERGEAVRRWMNAAWSWALEIVGFKRVAHQESSIMSTISVPQRSSLAPLSSSVSSWAILELLSEVNPDNCLNKLGQFYTFLALLSSLCHSCLHTSSFSFLLFHTRVLFPSLTQLSPWYRSPLPFPDLISLTNSNSLINSIPLHVPSRIARYNEDPNILPPFQ